MKKEKKVFVMGKVYTITETNISEIERAVQEDLDNMVGKDKVEFKLCTLGNVVAMFFNRPLEYSTLGADPRESIIGEDALILSEISDNRSESLCQYPTERTAIFHRPRQSQYGRGRIQVLAVWICTSFCPCGNRSKPVLAGSGRRN